MAKIYFQHDEISYLFDTKLLKLFRLEGNQSVEINNSETLWDVRLKASEISRNKAFKIAKGSLNWYLFYFKEAFLRQNNWWIRQTCRNRHKTPNIGKINSLDLVISLIIPNTRANVFFPWNASLKLHWGALNYIASWKAIHLTENSPKIRHLLTIFRYYESNTGIRTWILHEIYWEVWIKFNNNRLR